LTDASGTPNRGRIAAYRASLSRFAKQNPRRWGDFVASLAEPPR